MNNPENAIEVRNVKKFFKVYYDRGITWKDKILSRGRSRYEKREVLKGISFDVKKGEVIGLIGKNGCGKSTTLKLLTKIIYPNEGEIELQGRVSSLLELGAGFHPDMSGKENIYLNAAVFGLNHREIDKRVDDIIKFSELEAFIDNPVRTYSSGMYMRLAFSVAINVDADVLLIDEILAVGDISFQKKCFEKLKDIKRTGTTIVIVSHSLDQIEKICDRTIWIEDGCIKEAGVPREIHEKYLYEMEQVRLERFQEEAYDEMQENAEEVSEPAVNSSETLDIAAQQEISIPEANAEKEEDSENETTEDISETIKTLKKNFLTRKDIIHQGNQKVRLTDMYITDIHGNERLYFETGEDIVVYLKILPTGESLTGTIFLLLYRDDGVYCYGSNTYIENKKIVEIKKNQLLKITLEKVPLLSGRYLIEAGAHDEQAIVYEHVKNAATIQMFSAKGEQGICTMGSTWILG